MDGIHMYALATLSRNLMYKLIRSGSNIPADVMVDSEGGIPFDDILLALSQLVLPQGDLRDDALFFGMHTWKLVEQVLKYYIWPTSSDTIYHFSGLEDDSGCLMLIMNGLCSADRYRMRRYHPVSGLKLLRQRSTLPAPVVQSSVSIREYRNMLYISLFPDPDRQRTYYSIVTATGRGIRYLKLEERAVTSIYKPLYIYLSYVRSELIDIQLDWTQVLDLLDGEVNVTVSQKTAPDAL
jgi:hypothetical protein